MRAGAALAAAVAIAAPSDAEAQFTRTVQLCSSPLTYCANVGLNLFTQGGTQFLDVGIRNIGSTDGTTTSRITEFGLFGGGLSGGTLSFQDYVDPTGDGDQTLIANFATNGNGQDLSSGAGTTNVVLGADFGNNGFLPIYVDDQTSGGFQRLSTDAGEYGLFRFQLVGGSTINLDNIGVGIRVQSIGAAGASDKCFSSGIDANCTVTNNPPGGIGGGGTGSVVPEPSTYVLMATGLGALGMMARRRKQG